MPLHHVSLQPAHGAVAVETLRARIDRLVERAAVPDAFPAEVLAAADAAVAAVAGNLTGADRSDRTDVEFVTLDPPSSTDLDQAMHLRRTEEGFRVLYAIADVPLFVPVDGVIDAEARRRGQTVYLPDRRIPLHPVAISEAEGSILPDQDTPAFVWTLDLDARGAVTAVALERAVVRSRAKLAYDAVQQELDAGAGHPQMLLLQELGVLRREQEALRDGASLNLPEQEVVADGDSLRLSWRAPLPIEEANAQISLMTGMAAARVMLDGGAGILRTLPPADERAIERFRVQARALGAPWPEDQHYGAFLRTLDPADPRHLALLNRASSLFRGADYLAFTTPGEIPAEVHEYAQAAIGAPYAHTTAPLRRLVDRFVLLVCHAHLGGTGLPDPLRAALPLVPALMRETGTRGSRLERDAIDLVEASALAAFAGRDLEGTVIDRREASETTDQKTSSPARALVQLQDPPVTAWARSTAEAGSVIRVRVAAADPQHPSITLEEIPA